MMPEVASRSFSVMGFDVHSVSEMEIEQEYNLVKGDSLKVSNENGEVIHENVRGFMPLTDVYHIIRKEDGSWWYCTADGQLKKKSALSKRNIRIGSLALMFDERGKIRLGQQNAHYPMLSLR
ncbi:MAG: hypothetical protein NC218_08590 [Acetobacter sp.]|nr:hypothetical protein [Acetobacter sp.]